MNKYPSLIQNNQMPQIKDKPIRRPFLQEDPLLQGMNIYFMAIAFIWKFGHKAINCVRRMNLDNRSN